MRWRAVLELLLAVAAAVGCGFCWVAAQSQVVIPPVADGEPTTTSITYNPSLLGLAMVLATIAGVLLIVGVARMARRSPNLHSGSLPAENHDPQFTFGGPPA